MKINKKTKSNQKEAAIRFVLIFLALIPIIYIFYSMSTQIAARMAEELTLSYTADSPIYWTVGRGMLQDFKPYEDFYETKPPGIFLLSALSFRLFDSAILSNILCFLCLIVIGVTPLLAVICDLRKKTVPVLNRLTLILSAVLFGGMLMLYTQNRSGSAQVESFGAAFGCIYLFLISRMDGQTTKLRSPILWISSLFLMFSVMMKEPFVLVCCAAALLFINTWKDLLKKLILPLFAGGAAGVLLMLFTGTLIPYLQYHLPNMTGSHVGRYGSPITRGFDFKNILNDINIFSRPDDCLADFGRRRIPFGVLSAASVFAESVPGFRLCADLSRCQAVFDRLRIGFFGGLGRAVLQPSLYFCRSDLYGSVFILHSKFSVFPYIG